MEEVMYELKSSFEYAHKGDQRKAEFITLRSPTVENVGYVARLKQGFMQAIAGQQKQSQVEVSTDKGGVDDLTGEMIMAMLSMSDIDYAAYLQTAKAVFTDTGVALIDGEEPLKKALMAKMSVDDLEAMTGEYMKVFILTSALKMMQA